MKIAVKQVFQKHLQRRFSLRLHMFIILLVTTLSGVLFSKILLMFNVVNFAIRYPLAVVFSYLVFFACIKLWLICISPSKPDNQTSILEWLDIAFAFSVEALVEEEPHHFEGVVVSSRVLGPPGLLQGMMLPSSKGHFWRLLHRHPRTYASEGIGDSLGEAAGALGDDNMSWLLSF